MVQVSTEPKNPVKITGKGVDNYASGAIKLNPDDEEAETAKKKGVYSHLELNGAYIIRISKKLYEMMKKKEEGEER